MDLEYGFVAWWLLSGQVRKSFFDIEFEDKVFRLFDLDWVFEALAISKIAGGFEITERIEDHALSFFSACLFSWS